MDFLINNPLKIFNKYPEIFLTISEKKDKPLNLRKTENRGNFLLHIGIPSEKLIVADLEHGKRIKVVGCQNTGKIIRKTDGLITTHRGLFLSVTVADCLPIFIFHPQKKIVGLLHAGWKGLGSGIINNSIRLFKKEFDIAPKELVIGIGPGICQKHFEVKNDVAVKFEQYYESLLQKKGKIYLDLKKIAFEQLIEKGVLPSKVEVCGECTYCLKEKYFSYRREKRRPLNVLMVVFGIKEVV